MTRDQDALAPGAKQSAGDVARIDSATCLPAKTDGLGQSHRFGDRRLEHDMKQLDDELLRRVVVVMGDDLDVGGVRLIIGRGRSTLMS